MILINEIDFTMQFNAAGVIKSFEYRLYEANETIHFG
jgi:hypothetical protein